MERTDHTKWVVTAQCLLGDAKTTIACVHTKTQSVRHLLALWMPRMLSERVSPWASSHPVYEGDRLE